MYACVRVCVCVCVCICSCRNVAAHTQETDQLKVDRVAWIVADLVLKYAPFMLLYISYTNHHDVAVNTLARLEKHAGACVCVWCICVWCVFLCACMCVVCAMV